MQSRVWGAGLFKHYNQSCTHYCPSTRMGPICVIAIIPISWPTATALCFARCWVSILFEFWQHHVWRTHAWHVQHMDLQDRILCFNNRSIWRCSARCCTACLLNPFRLQQIVALYLCSPLPKDENTLLSRVEFCFFFCRVLDSASHSEHELLLASKFDASN